MTKATLTCTKCGHKWKKLMKENQRFDCPKCKASDDHVNISYP